MLLGIDTTGAAGDHGHGVPAPTTTTSPSAATAAPKSKTVKTTLIAVERTVLTLLSVAVSILIPEFASIMAVLGSTFSFLLCIIGPVSAKIALAGGLRRCGLGDGVLLVVSVGMAVWGTICAFESAAPVP